MALGETQEMSTERGKANGEKPRGNLLSVSTNDEEVVILCNFEQYQALNPNTNKLQRVGDDDFGNGKEGDSRGSVPSTQSSSSEEKE
ncbi:hypothetical protein BCON_0264g00110 [Botryotinia convoluta]|uniref:Uncharacterized protein n=1 Tax=Botryotinia convoluta TaxID=54673 RepID=A0A4Z1HFQ4_9HELO|nr:hypothetical protein BCON_0264g00110 [Botryotinia convoluta]